MRTWYVYYSDTPYDPLIIRATNYTKMAIEANKYLALLREQKDPDIKIIKVTEMYI